LKYVCTQMQTRYLIGRSDCDDKKISYLSQNCFTLKTTTLNPGGIRTHVPWASFSADGDDTTNVEHPTIYFIDL
jgi:hypothetical protein